MKVHETLSGKLNQNPELGEQENRRTRRITNGGETYVY
jgi:hypothetical protein